MAYTAKTAAAFRNQSGSLASKIASELSLIDAELEAIAAGDRTLNDALIFVGNAANVATGVAVSGDVTIANTGAVTIAAEAVTLAKMADLARGSIISGQTAGNRPTALDAKTNGQILVGDGNDVNSVAVSGDVTLSNAGVVAIGANKITNTMMNPQVLNVVTTALTGGAQNAFSFAWQNPEAVAILVWQVLVDITTPGGTGGAKLDVGAAANGTTHGDDMIDGVDANATALYSSGNVAGGGTNGKGAVKLAANGGATDYLTGQIMDANGNNLAGTVYIYYTALAA